MVYCPMSPGINFQNNHGLNYKYAMGDITNEFTPIGEKIKMITAKATTSNATTKIEETTFTIEERKYQVAEYSTTECSSIIPCFGIEDNIYKKLQDLPPPPENWQELPQTHKWGNIQEFTSDQKSQKEIQLRNELIEFFKKRYNGDENLANEVVHARIAEFQKKTPNVSWFKFHIDNFLTAVERQDLHTEPVPPNVQEVDEK